jgi:hypothetical protein
MATKASTTTAVKAERKKPVRTAPAQKDYPNKLAWLKAMTEHEEAAAKEATAARVTRLDKRIASKKATIATLTAELAKLEDERAALVGNDEGFDEFEIANGRDQA